MHWTLILTYILVFAWVAPAALWRKSSLALLISWSAAQAWYLLSGDSVPIPLYLVADAIVIAVILAFSKDRTDLGILAIFPAMWLVYFSDGGVSQWWALYWLAMTQFVLAGPWVVFARIGGNIQHGAAKEIHNGVN